MRAPRKTICADDWREHVSLHPVGNVATDHSHERYKKKEYEMRLTRIEADSTGLRMKYIIFLLLVVAVLAMMAREKAIDLPNYRAELKPAAMLQLDTNATVSHHNAPEITFGKAMVERLNWTKFESSLDDDVALTTFAREVFYLAFTFAIMEPKTPINFTCQAPELLNPQPHMMVMLDKIHLLLRFARLSQRAICSTATYDLLLARWRTQSSWALTLTRSKLCCVN